MGGATSTTNADRRRGARGLSRIGEIAVLATGLGVLFAGWIFGLDGLVRMGPDFPAMVPSTAICFALLGAALLIRPRVDQRWSAMVLRVVAAVVAAIAIVDLFLLTTGVATGVDALFIETLRGSGADTMAFATAFDFLLGAWCLYDLAKPLERRRSASTYVFVATTGLLTAAIAIVGFAFDADALYGVFIFTAMALQTALAFCLLFASLLLERPDAGWVGVVVGPGVGGAGARRLLPVIVVGNLLLCFGALVATNAGWFSANFRLSALAIAMTVISALAVLRNARIENRNEERLLSIKAELEATATDKALLLREVYHRVKNNLQQINAMIAMERRKLEDPEAREALSSLSGRVHTLGMVHQRLMEADRPSTIELGAYLTSLCDDIASIGGLEAQGIKLTAEVEPHVVELEIAVPIGLIVNELVTNAIKHGFPPGAGGAVTVTFGLDGDRFQLVVADDGCGSGELLSHGTGVGARIVSSLITQLHAEKGVETGDGTTWKLWFPLTLETDDRDA